MTKSKKASKGSIDFKKGFGDVVAANPKIWEHDRSQSVGASEVFGCLRHARFKKMHPEMATVPEELDPEWGHTERGNIVENEFAVPCLRGMFGQEQCFYMGEEQRTFVDGRLSATPDGLVIDQPRDALSEYGVPDIGPSAQFATEVKSFGGEFAAPRRIAIPNPADRGVNKFVYEAKPKHKGQTIVQMGLFRRKTNYQPDFAAVIYINPTNLKDIRPAVVPYDDAVYLRAKERAESVFDETKTLADFPAEGRLINECQYCDFEEACTNVDMVRLVSSPKAMSKFSDQQVAEFERMARRVAQMRAQVKALEEEKKEAEADLKELLLSEATNKVAGEGWSASLSRNNGRKSLDKDRLAEDLNINLEDYTTEGNPYFVLRVKAE